MCDPHPISVNDVTIIIQKIKGLVSQNAYSGSFNIQSVIIYTYDIMLEQQYSEDNYQLSLEVR